MRWVQVVDDVVKIGLGALIGAIGSYMVARFYAKTELEKERSGRQQELIGEIALKVESFHSDFMRYVQLIDVDGDLAVLKDDWMRTRIKENRKRREDLGEEAVARARQVAKESNDDLPVYPRIYIRLLRTDALQQSFQAYAQAAEVLWIESGRRGVGMLKPEQYEDLLSKYHTARDTLRDSLAEVFPLRLDRAE